MVRVMRGGEEVKISKRAGSYVTLRDLIEWSGAGDMVRGRDAVRFFLVSRKGDSEFTFDVDLALARSDENPVYYVQYAHARISSIIARGSVAAGSRTAMRRPLACRPAPGPADHPARVRADGAAGRLPGDPGRGGRRTVAASPLPTT